jgi:hypothetical protein
MNGAGAPGASTARERASQRELSPSALLALMLTFLLAGAAVLALVDSPIRFAFATTFLIVGVFCGLAVFQPRPVSVSFDERGIELRGRRARRLELHQIRGIRQRSHRGSVTTIILEPLDARAKPLELSVTLVDATFWGWARDLPDLDAQHANRVEAELLASPALGKTVLERKAAIARAPVVARLLNWPAVAAGCWAAAAPSSPWAVAWAFIFPLAALLAALRGGGAFQVLKAANDPRPSLRVALFVPVLFASIRVFEYQLVSPGSLLLPALGSGAVLTALAATGDRSVRRRPLELLVLLALMVGVSASGLTFANSVQDASPAFGYEAPLLDKWVNRGRRSSSLALTLGPWTLRPGKTTVFVPRRIFDAVAFGEPVRVCVRAGRLGFAWFWVSPGVACSDSRPTLRM